MTVRDAIDKGIKNYKANTSVWGLTLPGAIMATLECDPRGAYREAVRIIDARRNALEAKK